MLKLRQVAPITAALLCAGCAQPRAVEDAGTVQCALPASDSEWIRGLVAQHQAQVLAGDYEAMLPDYSENVVVMIPNQPAFSGREGIREFQSGFPKVDDYELDALEIIGCGDLAVARGTYSMSMAIEGVPYTDSGKWIYVLRQQPDGTWAINMDIFNSDRPKAGT